MRIKTVKLKLRREHLERLMIGGAAALVLFLAARGFGKCRWWRCPIPRRTEEVNTIAQTQTPTQRTTTIFYKDGNGYLVPVTMEVPQQEGIAKATLSLLTSSPVNDIEAASLGAFDGGRLPGRRMSWTLPTGVRVSTSAPKRSTRRMPPRRPRWWMPLCRR